MKVRELIAILSAAGVDQDADVKLFEYTCTSLLRMAYQQEPGTVWLTSETPESRFDDEDRPDVAWFVCPAVNS
jgi:hypothetical protein